MCGILAILSSHLSESAVRQKLLDLSKRIRHRGPDWNGVHIQQYPNGDRCGLAHERLAIVDPLSGKQPLFDDSELVCVTVNGEIYNHQALRKLLDEGTVERFKSQSDCAVIPFLYKKFGESFVDKLDGMFAFVLSDRSTGMYLAARDPLGICPLYVGWASDGSVWFASEMKALMSDCVEFDQFPPGHIFSSKLRGGRGGFERYYSPSWFPLDAPLSTKKLDLEVLRQMIERAVEKRLMCDVPFGVLLSGGLDSSVVAAVANRKLQQLVASGEIDGRMWFSRLHSFSIGMHGSPDLAAARKAAEFLGTAHHEFTFSLQEGVDALRDVIWHIETYDVTTIRASVPMYFLGRIIKSMGIKLVLSGEGADEVFGGYLYFHKAPNKEEFHRETQRKLRALYQYDLLRANKSMMAFGVEVRVPFLDKEVLNVAMDLDPEEKMCTKGRIEKWPVRAAFEGYLPESILWRQKEQFSDGVGYSWIDGLKDHAEKAISDKQLANASLIFQNNTPTTKEAYLYRSVFHEVFPFGCAAKTVPGGPSIACSTAKAIEWDKSFKFNADQSGRSVLGVHNKATAFVDAQEAAARPPSPRKRPVDLHNGHHTVIGLDTDTE